ncbi:MAG TPA: cation:proton antiporter [Luteitalea sp.]|nr:cation:proton antiporter [Luteitalea sp.]
MHSYDLILTLTSGLAVALLFGYLTHRLGLSPIVGYLMAGICVGPYTPGYVADSHLAEQMAEIGVILLMFGVGLQFHLEELLAVRRVAVPGALAQSGAATALGALLAVSIGWSWSSGLVFGMALAVASTVVLIRVLADKNDLHTRAGHIAVGWLVVEDLLTVLALVLLPALFDARASVPLWWALLLTLGKVGALVAFTAVIGTRALPRLLDHVAHTRSRELFTLTVLVIALGIAVGSALVFSVSMALGAFLAGLVVGRSEYSLRAASEALPLRDAFAVLFFVSVGMLLDPRALLASPMLLAGALAIVLVAKPAVAFGFAWILRYPLKVSLSVAIALAQIGEFSFILSSLGRELGVLDAAATNTLVATSILSIVLNPLLYGAVDPVERWVSRRPRLWARLNWTSDTTGEDGHDAALPDAEHQAVIVGYGPTGRTIARLLRENEIRPTVVELNIDTVRAIRDDGGSAIYGDASNPDTLSAAGIAKADTLILSSSGMASGPDVIRTARALNPRIAVLVRAAYLREVDELRAAGADTVFSGEGEVALAFTEHMLERLGATAEQIERERARAREALTGNATTVPA